MHGLKLVIKEDVVPQEQLPHFPAIEKLAAKGLLAVETWNSKRAMINFKATIEVPMLGSMIERCGDTLDESHSVLRSCALVKLYNAVSCTSLWMSSRAVLAVVSWSTCCCRRSKVSASLLSSVDSVPFFCRRGMSGRTWVFWQQFKQGWAREQHRVPWRVLWHQKLPTGKHQLFPDTIEDREKTREKTGHNHPSLPTSR